MKASAATAREGAVPVAVEAPNAGEPTPSDICANPWLLLGMNFPSATVRQLRAGLARQAVTRSLLAARTYDGERLESARRILRSFRLCQGFYRYAPTSRLPVEAKIQSKAQSPLLSYVRRWLGWHLPRLPVSPRSRRNRSLQNCLPGRTERNTEAQPCDKACARTLRMRSRR